ncbi:hypothetical protein [Streptomyces sp. SP17KL33]|uniref:hypothetical protein n=1 Tax=Streptomyces sp. SP17KL33 TaxID=3002534 RepID=UPI002E759BE6|nr:hypothetical protein [Streptomyces sp. SP17KL33]MEE1836791.1 hypothetical protein [Streptomyces sp. SP17KL33]
MAFARNNVAPSAKPYLRAWCLHQQLLRKHLRRQQSVRSAEGTVSVLAAGLVDSGVSHAVIESRFYIATAERATGLGNIGTAVGAENDLEQRAVNL